MSLTRYKKNWVSAQLRDIYALPTAVVPSVRTGPAANAYLAAVLADTPLMFLRCEETAGTAFADSSGNGRNATGQGTVTRNTASATTNLGVGFTIAGAGWLTVPNAGLALTGDATYECWLKASSVPNHMVFMSTGNQGGIIGYDFYWSSSSQLVWESGAGSYCSTGTGAVSAGTWYHLAATRSGAGSFIYLNGAQVASGAQGPAASSTSMALSFGCRWDGSGIGPYPFFGVMDEIAIYSTALSPTRVAAHYAART